MLNMNNKPNMMARIPTIIFSAENSPIIDIIPNNTKLTPIMMDTRLELKIGKIIKIIPKIIDNNPYDLLASIFFPPNFFVMLTSQVKNMNFKKQHTYYLFYTI